MACYVVWLCSSTKNYWIELSFLSCTMSFSRQRKVIHSFTQTGREENSLQKVQYVQHGYDVHVSQHFAPMTGTGSLLALH